MIDSLPEELLCKIIVFLSLPDPLNLFKTCESLNTVGKKPEVWLELLSEHERERAVRTKPPQSYREEYLKSHLVKKIPRVLWKRIHVDHETPSEREGHLMCVMGNHGLVVTGGFCDDEKVHLLDVAGREGWKGLTPKGGDPPFVYGASLTYLGNGTAVRFGGFRAGGYFAECNDTYLLSLDAEKLDGGSSEIVAKWEEVKAVGNPPLERAYHSATLMDDRYLVIIGGMTPYGSILEVAVLDVQTWTWIDQKLFREEAEKPSVRHGHSVAWDQDRQRMILFGGGNGCDLLRNGVDNAEVWELRIPRTWQNGWSWHILSHGEDLTSKEKLCLGRCHLGLRPSSSTVLLVTGGGRVSTNGVLGYDLIRDAWMRPKVINEPNYLPMPRFTGVAAVVDDWVVLHGGYTTGVGSLGDLWALDLAPGMGREFANSSSNNLSAPPTTANQPMPRTRRKKRTRL